MANKVVRTRGRKLVSALLLGVLALTLLAGCGRVNLEDLTPKAARTQLAIEASWTPTPEPATPTPGADGASGPTPITGDIAAGSNIYNATCSGCHEGARAESLKGKSLDLVEWLPRFRTGEGFGGPHPKYEPTAIRPLSDSDFQDVFAYLQQSP